jgi:CRISPR-associated protein Cas6
VLPYLKPLQEKPSQVQLMPCHLVEIMSQPHIELSFRVFGQTLPIDHGYGLYAALSKLRLEVHQLQGVLGIQAITGDVCRELGSIQLTESSQLRIRLPAAQIPLIYSLAGQKLTIGKHQIRLGIPQTYLLKPCRNLYARIVVIKGYQEAEDFLQAAQRQLDQLEIQGKLRIAVRTNGTVKRKTIKIARYVVSGFGLEVSGLSDEDSLKLQIVGIGGKRKMGCGIFVPIRGTTDAST